MTKWRQLAKSRSKSKVPLSYGTAAKHESSLTMSKRKSGRSQRQNSPTRIGRSLMLKPKEKERIASAAKRKTGKRGGTGGVFLFGFFLLLFSSSSSLLFPCLTYMDYYGMTAHGAAKATLPRMAALPQLLQLFASSGWGDSRSDTRTTRKGG